MDACMASLLTKTCVLLCAAAGHRSHTRIPAPAAATGRPLLAADGRWGDQQQARTSGVVVADDDSPVIVLPSIRRPWNKLLPLAMKPAGHSCETWRPNNKDCPTPPRP
ncbi:hypothetical protein PVAP13_4KG232900 [Panicum virgatum]|uniref:Secreted protein n=1 Tax=Panicum virgatum TaxID=38727 RepID=A0A8T0TLA6_PANVG|nr:hypothetical protein PVAP13_4KG232900 [Panicum virgatum]